MLHGASKLENIYLNKVLKKNLDESKKLKFKNVKALALHPGAVHTELARYMMEEQDFVSMMDLKDVLPRFTLKASILFPLVYFTKSTETGATTRTWLVAGEGDELKGGVFS